MKKARSRRDKAKDVPPDLLRARVLDAAFAAFIEKGYGRTSTLEIATRARISKRDLYRICPDKPALLRRAIVERARRMRLPLELPPPPDRRALATMLAALGAAVLGGVCDPAVRAVYRLAIAQVGEAPEIARVLDSAGPAASRAALARALKQAQAAGLIGPGDPAAMAVEFFALLWGDLLLQLLFGIVDPPPPPLMRRKAMNAAEKFLRIYPPPRPKPMRRNAPDARTRRTRDRDG